MDTQERPSDPFSPALQRITAMAGIGFAVLFVATIALSGEDVPAFDAPVAEWSAYAEDNQDGQRLSLLAFSLAVYAFVLFLGCLRSHLGQAELAARGFTRPSHFVSIGGTLGIAGLAVGIGLSAASILHADTPPETIRALNDLATAGFIIAAPGFAAMFITVFLIEQAVRALPAWLGWTALITGVAFLLQLGTLLDETGDNAFGIAYPVGFLGLAVFSIGASLTMAKRIE